MKFALILLTIALVAQIAMAGVLRRSKRDAADDDFESVWKAMKLVAQKSGEAVKKTLEKIPKTDAYAKYREELEDFLKDYNEYESKKGLCFVKTADLLSTFQEMDEEWEKDNAPAEAKEVDTFFVESLKEVLGDEGAKMMQHIAEDEKRPKKLEEDVDTIQALSVMFEVC